MVLSVKVKDDPPQESLTCTMCDDWGLTPQTITWVHRNTLYLVQYLSEGKEALEVFTEFVILVIETSYQPSPRIERGGCAAAYRLTLLNSGLGFLQQGIGGTPSRETHQMRLR